VRWRRIIGRRYPSEPREHSEGIGEPSGTEGQLTPPVIGDVVDGFVTKLDAENVLRLPSITADGGALGKLWLAAASLSGLSHLHHGSTGQDSYSFRAIPDTGGAIIAVADGLGSRPDSAQVGATVLTRLLCASIASAVSQATSEAPASRVSSAISHTNDAFRSLRLQYFPHLTEDAFFATVAFLWVQPSSSGLPLTAVVGRIGDCAAFTLRDSRWVSIFSRGDEALNVVKGYLPTHNPLEVLELKELELQDGDVAILTTDGVAEDLFASDSLRQWLASVWNEPCDPFRMLQSLRYRRRGSHDDRTAAVVWFPSPCLERTDGSPSGTPKALDNTVSPLRDE
jgi:serine/threonine protein phosphatase PrpC